ncbi:MAG TPA: LysR family transcriptional regulator [bacterium]|jgi:LysR family hydrogen peroxide-inducible transcriptional activator|nr:LysR family transcriptional regulator [bacterium]
MELHQLRYFLAVAETGSFTAAARRCHVAQPSLSVQIAKLESELGGSLLERGRKGARLTQRGELFKPRAAEVLRQVEAARLESEELAGLKRGSVGLGCMPTTGAYLLPKLIKAFSGAHPGLRLDLREESSPTLAALLREKEVDLAIIDDAGLGAGLAWELLFSEPLLLAVPPGHRFAGRKRLALAALRGEPLIVMKTGHGFRGIVLEALARAGVEPRVVHESGEIETVQALVEAGLGLALVPSMVRKAGGPVYLDLAEPRPSRSLFLAWRQAATLTKAAEALRAAARTVLRRP